MKKRILSMALIMAMLLSCAFTAVAAGEPATSGDGPVLVPEGYVPPEVAGATNLDPAKGDLMINGVLLLNAEGGRADSLETAANVPEGFYESQEYQDYLNPPAEVKPPESSFPDVEITHKHFDAIEAMKKNGYIVGFEDGTFRPANNVTRAEFVKVLIEKDGGIEKVPADKVSGFTDVDTNPPHWAQKYIALGVEKGYLAGMGDGTFAPNATITYEQAMKIFVCHFGLEAAAKSKITSTTPLWPNAYVLTGEQMFIHTGTGLAMGNVVNRGQFAQMLHNGITTVSQKVNNPNVPTTGGGGFTGGGGGGGNSRDEEDDESEKITGIIVSTYGIAIDPEAPVSNSEAYIYLSYTDRESGETRYERFREPYDSANRGGKNMYKDYLGYEVTFKYVYETDHNEIVKNSLKVLDSNKKTVVKAEDFMRAETIASMETDEALFTYKEDRKTKTIKLPENLDDMAVVYNGVPIDYKHPSHDHDFDHDESYIKITDLLPQNGSVTFLNRNNGDVELAIVETYDTLVPVGSMISGVVTDKFDETKKYTLNADYLVPQLDALYSGHRDITAADVDIVVKKKNGTSYTVVEGTSASSAIRSKTSLTIYTSRDLTKVEVLVSGTTAGGSSTTGVQVTTGYDADEQEIVLGNTTYKISDYLYENVETGKYDDIEDMNELFPLGEYVVAYQDVFGEIVAVEIKDPTYVYGYLADVDYEERGTADDSYFEMRIITKDNVSKYATPENQIFKVKKGGKIKVDGIEYRYSNFDELADALAASARVINYGTVGSGNKKPDEVLTHATYAQPIRFVKGAAADEIKIIQTMVPTLGYSENAVWNDYQLNATNYVHDPANISKKYMIGSNAVIFSVPDDRFDYDRYEIKPRSYMTAYKRCNPEIYSETTSTGSTVYNCVVLYDEGISGRPSIESPISIVKSIDFHQRIDDENIYKIIVYQSSSITSTSEKTYYVTEGERKDDDIGVRYDVGDVIVFGTTKIGSLSAIKNVRILVDISDRTNDGFSAKYERDGAPCDDSSPYYWFRYGTVVDFDKDSDSMRLDVGEDELMSVDGTGLFFSSTNSNTLSKPPYFYVNEDGDPDIAKAVTERFATHNLGEMVQQGDMIFMFASGSSCLQKCIYLIPATDRDELYPRDISELTRATVTFNVATEGASVTIAGRNVAVSEGTAVFENITEGIYTYTVSAENYEPLTGTLIVRNGVTSYTVNGSGSNPIELVRYTGGARFNIMPGNATITIEGVNTVTGNKNVNEMITVDFPGLELGTEYNYTISAEGYVTETGSFTVESRTEPFETDISLEPVLYDVTFNVTYSGEAPANATIEVDGEVYDIVDGSVTVPLAAGQYDYTIFAEGYESIWNPFEVTDGELTVDIALSKVFMSVTFNLLPEGAVVEINGIANVADSTGILIFANVTEGATYTVTAEDYEVLTGTVEADVINVELTPVTPDPEG